MRRRWVRRLTRGVLWTIAFVCVAALALGSMLLFLGRVPTTAERNLIGAALGATVVAALVATLVHGRVQRGIARVTGGNRAAPSDLARSISSRMSRSVPLDELVLQVAEGLRASLRLRSAEVWILDGRLLRPWIGDPGIDRSPMPLGDFDPAAVIQAGLSGHGWLQVWMPEMLEGREQSFVRMAPMANSGELHGVVVVERPVEVRSFTPEEERALVEVARQLGAVLHNAKLDSALQASLDEVRRQSAELQASRGRIVAAADQARRKIERDLHDGAQQHIVALAVRVKLATQLVETDRAKAHEALDGIAAAIEDALQELRDLAHGIYPPLLADKGLPAALASAARRSSLPVEVRADGLARYTPEAEATVYFCVLEALQNAGKYAGDNANVTVDVRANDGNLVFVVSDDGQGFEVRDASMGTGFTNMLDRLGAQRGTLHVDSAPGQGTRVTGSVPAMAPTSV